jgi:hypothetical protein
MVMKQSSFLPENVSGRGTARRSRVVEGQACLGLGHDVTANRVQIQQNIGCSDAQCFNACGTQPYVPCPITGRTVPAPMKLPIDFDGQAAIAAEKIQNIRACRMLPAELDALRPLPQLLPQQDFRQGHLASPFARQPYGLSRSAQHRISPSTMLRMVPLPETSSGRIVE